MNSLNRYNPIIVFIYFAVVIFITMFSMNPLILSISLICSVSLYGFLVGFKKLSKNLLFSLIIILLLTITNPLFSNQGETILFYIGDLEIRKESLIYGLFMGIMIVSTLFWFQSYNLILTSDKFIYLFGKAIPKLSLLLVISLNLIPKFYNKYKDIAESQKALGIYQSDKFFDKIKCKMREISILITWSLENSIDTADSMRARGYGLKNRTNYSIYKWTFFDTIFTIFVIILAFILIFMLFSGFSGYSFYPYLTQIELNFKNVIFFSGLLIMMSISTIFEIGEIIKWRFLKSKI